MKADARATDGGWAERLRASSGFHKFVERGLWPLLTLLAGLAATRLQHVATEARVEEKAAEVSKESTEATRAAWKGLARPANRMAGELEALRARLTALEATQKAQSALIVARERDFVVEGAPAPARRHRVDAGLVKAVRDNAAKDAKELAARAAKPVPVLAPIPLEPPKPGAPKPAVPPAPAPASVEPPKPPAPDARADGHP